MKDQVKYHKLDLTFSQFQSLHKSISNTSIGKYYIYEMIGQGAFGQVYKGMDDQTKLPVAVKIINLHAINKESNARMKEVLLRLSKNEDKMMDRCNSPNLVKCYDVYINNDFKIIVMQFCNRGTLDQEIKSRKTIPQKQAILILKQILNGIAELHSHRIIHRDLKAENILLHNSLLKIADFGFSKELQICNDEAVEDHTILGTLSTMAPEVLARRPYGLKADIWSAGIIFFHMLFGHTPFAARSKPDMLNKIEGSKLMKKINLTFQGITISQQTYNFLKLILVIDQKERIGWKQLINHPIFKQSQKRLSRSVINDIEIVAPRDSKKEDQQECMDEGEEIEAMKSLTETKKLIRVVKEKIDEKKSELKQREEDIGYEWIEQKLHECLKTELVYEEIIEKIEQNKILNLQKRKAIELMYLLSTRCFLDLSPINEKIKEINKKDPEVARICNHISTLYGKLRQSWQHYSRAITEEENSIVNMIKDFFESREVMKTKNSFMNGIESQDYIKRQQVQFIQSEYIRPLIKKITSKQHEKVKDLLLFYKEIVLEEPVTFKKEGFDVYIQHLVQK